MENHAGDMDYMENEYAYDVSMEQKYLALMSRYHITSSGDAEKLRNNIDHWETQYRELSTKLQKMKAKLTDYENHVGIIRESSRGSREEYDTAWEEFDRIQSGGKETERKQEGERSRQSKSHRERDRS
jgi:phage shock protein A